ncbi:MAG: 50S ribosomal protein L11 methyltransferase [Vicinamibacterales bacterium]
MAEARTWPALEIRSDDVDTTGDLGGLLSAVLADFQPLAIQDLIPPPLPPGGLWDPTAPPPPEPPPTAIAWRVCFADQPTRDAALAAVAAQTLDGVTTAAVDLPDDDWVAKSQASLTAVHAGRFIVAPPWDLPAATPDGVQVIVIEPSMGFGTGHHQTTRLCLAAMSTLDLAGRTVLDLGTGSGVLAMAASLLGASDVRGVDIDADAIAAAVRSAALNVLPTPVAFDTADVFVTPPAPAEVVLANLTGAMLIRSAREIAALTAAGGTLVISGFMAYERPGVEAALDAFDVTARSQEDEWCAAVLRRR